MKKLLAVLLLVLLPVFEHQSFAAGSPSLDGRVIVVDPGHGGYDPGAVRGSVCEKDINLQVAVKLKKFLEGKGARVMLTRDGDYNLAVIGLHKRQAHRYDLSKRLEVANQSRAGLFVSVHANCTFSRNQSGAEVFYFPRSEKSKLLAECIQGELRTIPGSNKRLAKTSQCYVLRNAGIPAALVEVGYLSNPGERIRLLRSDYQEVLAGKICSGIQEYIDKTP